MARTRQAMYVTETIRASRTELLLLIASVHGGVHRCRRPCLRQRRRPPRAVPQLWSELRLKRFGLPFRKSRSLVVWGVVLDLLCFWRTTDDVHQQPPRRKSSFDSANNIEFQPSRQSGGQG